MTDANRPTAGEAATPADSRAIPSIEQLRQRPGLRALETRYGRETIVEALRAEAEVLRARLRDAKPGTPALPATPAAIADYLERRAAEHLGGLFAGSLRRVINATGVIVHTNLGRAPLSDKAIERLAEVARGYSNLEFDLSTGRRGKRDVHAAELLARLTGAESAVVVNNNAAATLLLLAALAPGREVIVSRGELVEIGGGFRVPEVMAQSGAVLREIGTTNKTRIADYERAIGDRTGLILRVHRSNFRIEGFTEQPSLAELVALGRRAGLPVAEDLGSGWLGADALRSSSEILATEPTVRASLGAGIGAVCFSGDKLLGGPQAGIIVGSRDLLQRCRTHPLMRALRVDKLTYAALEATLVEYLAGRAPNTIPVAQMLAATTDAIEARARAVMQAVGHAERFEMQVADGSSMVGGGSAPGLPIATRLLVLKPQGGDAATLETDLRSTEPPVIARIEQECVLLDFRTVLPEEDAQVANALHSVAGGRRKAEGGGR